MYLKGCFVNHAMTKTIVEIQFDYEKFLPALIFLFVYVIAITVSPRLLLLVASMAQTMIVLTGFANPHKAPSPIVAQGAPDAQERNGMSCGETPFVAIAWQ